MVPALGCEFFGMLGVMRHSMAWPEMVTRGGDNFREAIAGGDADLALTRSMPVNHPGDAVLDLDARVHLDEVELAVLVHEELDGPCVPVADVLCHAQWLLRRSARIFGRDHEAGGLFDELLVRRWMSTALVAEAPPCSVGENLELDVGGRSMNFFEVEVAVAEGAPRPRRRPAGEPGQLSAERTMRIPRPPPPAAALSMTGSR